MAAVCEPRLVLPVTPLRPLAAWPLGPPSTLPQNTHTAHRAPAGPALAAAECRLSLTFQPPGVTNVPYSWTAAGQAALKNKNPWEMAKVRARVCLRGGGCRLHRGIA